MSICRIRGKWLHTAYIAVELRIPRFSVKSLIDGPRCPSDRLKLSCRRIPGYLSGLLLLLSERLALTLGCILGCDGIRPKVGLIDLTSLVDEAMGRRLNICAW